MTQSRDRSERTSPDFALRLMALFVAVGEATLVMVNGAPPQHRWLAGAIVVAVIVATASRDAVRRLALLGFLSLAAVVNRLTVLFDWNLSLPLATLDVSAAGVAALGGALAVRMLTRHVGPQTALLAGCAGVMIVACFALVLERSPGARLAISADTISKGPWPHRTFGRWYPPYSRVRSFYTSNVRNYYDPPVSLRRQWRLNVHSARDSAELRFDPAKPAALRAEIFSAAGGNMWGIQLNQGPVVVRANTGYELRFAARADHPRAIGVGISEWHAPWQGLGYYRTVHLDTTWTKWTDTLTLLRDDTNARIHFDVGQYAASVELSDVTLTEAATGRRVDTELFSLTHQFNDVGCRGPDVLRPADAAERSILVLGDAYALGLGVRDGDLFAARLGNLLEPAAGSDGSAGGSIRAITCAVPGWGARQERQFYEYVRRRYSPELVVVVTTWNDGGLGHDDSPLSPDQNETATVDRIVPELRRLAELARSDGAAFGVVVFRNTPSAVWEPTVKALASLSSEGVPVLDLWPTLSAHARWQDLVTDPPDGILPNEKAHGVAATAAASFLRDRRLID